MLFRLSHFGKHTVSTIKLGYVYFRICLSVLILLASSTTIFAQSTFEKESKGHFTWSPQKGLRFKTEDDAFYAKMGFRMQSRLTLNEADRTSYEAKINRLRFDVDGYIVSPKFAYELTVNFSPDDFNIGDKERISLIRDLYFSYNPNNNWSLIIGQTKLPSSRQSDNSSGKLQLTDRTFNNSDFNTDRDLGVQAHYYQLHDKRFSYAIKTALSSGKGLQYFKTDYTSYTLSGKVELYPLGDFKNNGAYSEGDIEREETPKILLSGAYHYNHNASMTKGLHGNRLYEPRDLQSAYLDIMIKYNGWSAMASYLNRSAQDPVTTDNDTNQHAILYIGHGLDYQLSYIFPRDYELIGRFSNQKMDNKIYEYNFANTKAWSLGLTRYIWQHKLKWQAEFTYKQEEFITTTKDSWYTRIQFDILL